MENGKYLINVFCKNCDFRNKIEILKGTLVTNSTCPNCGNNTLDKDFVPETGTQSYYNFD